jgi:hypothetical protein
MKLGESRWGILFEIRTGKMLDAQKGRLFGAISGLNAHIPHGA